MTDIVELLRRQADSDERAGTLFAHEIGRDAADEIERLRAEIDRLAARITHLEDEPLNLLVELKALNAELSESKIALSYAITAMRAPLDAWKGELERTALDFANAAMKGDANDD